MNFINIIKDKMFPVKEPLADVRIKSIARRMHTTFHWEDVLTKNLDGTFTFNGCKDFKDEPEETQMRWISLASQMDEIMDYVDERFLGAKV